jgi:hypothetical protein
MKNHACRPAGKAKERIEHFLSGSYDMPDGIYCVLESAPIVLSNTGVPLDEVEDLLLQSAAYRQASRVSLSTSVVTCVAGP